MCHNTQQWNYMPPFNIKTILCECQFKVFLVVKSINVAPIIGSAIGNALYRLIFSDLI